MRKSNESSLKELIDQMLDNYRLRDRLNEVRITSAWESLMGNAICNRTTSLRIKNEALHISVSSAPLREELGFQKDRIMELMNKELGGNFIKEVVIR